MTYHSSNSPGMADKMIAVKAAWDEAAEGSKKDAALHCYRSAERAGSDDETSACLDAVMLALA